MMGRFSPLNKCKTLQCKTGLRWGMADLLVALSVLSPSFSLSLSLSPDVRKQSVSECLTSLMTPAVSIQSAVQTQGSFCQSRNKILSRDPIRVLTDPEDRNNIPRITEVKC